MLPLPFVLMVLASVAVLSHWSLIPAGLNIHDSEWSTFLLWADAFREGHFSAFAFQQDYGGADLEILRALWNALWRYVDHSPQASVHAHMAFSYGICPALMSWASYFLLRSYCSRSASLAVALVCAVGFQHWVFQYSNDLYPSLYLMGCLLLGWRARLRNPFMELRPRGLLLAGILAGHAYYLMPAAQIYILAFLVPLRWVIHECKFLWFMNFTSCQERFLRKVALGFLALGGYIEVFGRDFGSIGNHALKMDGEPNLKIGFAIAFILWVRSRWADYFSSSQRLFFLGKILLLAMGFVLGDLPEIVANLSVGRLFTPRAWATYDFDAFMKVAGVVPSAIRVLVGGGQTYRALGFTDQTFGDVVSVFLLLLGAFCLLARKNEAQSDGSSKPHFDGLIFTGALCLFLYCKTFTKVPEFAPPRYLFPIFPVLVVCFGLAWQAMAGSRFWILAPVLFGLHATHHLASRSHLAAVAAASHRQPMIKEIVSIFRNAGVEVVVSEDFWFSNTFTVFSEGRPMFWSHWRDWGPFEAKHLALTEKRVGIMVKVGGPEDVSRRADLVGRHFRLTPLARVADRALFVGDAEAPEVH